MSLYKVVDCLRFPWRRDLKLKLKVLKKIYSQDTTIANTFYNSAFLDVVDYDWYAHIDERVEEMRKAFVPKTKEAEEECHV